MTLNAQGKTILLSFDLAVVLLFGFIAWKPDFWVSMTPIKKPFTDDQLKRFYRWASVVVLIGTLVDSILRLADVY
jgi:hypothetical protein